MEGTITWITLIGVVVSVIGYLLSRKDTAQEAQIYELYHKHEEDAARLQALEIRIAGSHYQKPEVDRLLDKFKGYLDEKFLALEHLVKEKHP